MHTWLVEVSPSLSGSYPQNHRVWCTGGRAQGRGVPRVYGIRREKLFSRIDSHVIDVLKVARRGDQTGVVMRGWIRETWLSKTKKGEKAVRSLSNGISNDSYVLVFYVVYLERL